MRRLTNPISARFPGIRARGVLFAAVVAFCAAASAPVHAKGRVHIGLRVGPVWAPVPVPSLPPSVICLPPAPVVCSCPRGHWEWRTETVLAGYETRVERFWVPERCVREQVWDPRARCWVEQATVAPGHYERRTTEEPVYETVRERVWVEDGCVCGAPGGVSLRVGLSYGGTHPPTRGERRDHARALGGEGRARRLIPRSHAVRSDGGAPLPRYRR